MQKSIGWLVNFSPLRRILVQHMCYATVSVVEHMDFLPIIECEVWKVFEGTDYSKLNRDYTREWLSINNISSDTQQEILHQLNLLCDSILKPIIRFDASHHYDILTYAADQYLIIDRGEWMIAEYERQINGLY
ncbi:hypothetical protein [Endozoicomonas sp. ONNA1]|uniref:hypothetical protein n=1 Tax=Endozoicomonas sp. ONNA1 TaxID=2828740 RepID=UPI002148C73D|nr:hypothetical protein [Endozoicomonas sp. ONNA1]